MDAVAPPVAPPFAPAELAQAADLVHRFVPPTPQHEWPLLSAALGACVWVKHENHTPTGAFKVRGGVVYVARRQAGSAPPAALIAATRGNHGQSVAFAGRAFGMRVTIVVPHGNSPDKNAAMRAFGAELVEHGHDFQAALEHAGELASAGDVHFVPSFHTDLVLGVATYAHELLTTVPDLDTVYVPVGLGSGICGLIAVRDLLGLPTEIVGVVADRAPATALSFEAGHPVATETADTVIDGVACRVPDPDAIRAIVAGAARIVRVSDDAAAEASRLLYTATHNVAEPAGAAALAGLMVEAGRQRGRRVAVVQTGGNLDTALLRRFLPVSG